MLSVIIPCYNSQPILREMIRLINIETEKLPVGGCEIILVNDASPNKNTLPFLKELASENDNIILIDLVKNGGQSNAQMAGLNYATGDLIINMDDDMQTHPKNIPALYHKLQEGYDVVWGKYIKKKHSLFRCLLTKMCSIFDKSVLGLPKNIELTSFWIITKYVRDEMINYKGPYAYIGGLILRSSNPNNIANKEIEHFEREQGTSGYNLYRLIKLWSNFTNFTILPLRVTGVIGILVSILSFFYLVFLILRKLLVPDIVIGFTSIMAIILFFFGLVLISLGTIGEYIGRIYMIINDQPQYIIKEVIKSTTTSSNNNLK